jgi:hypothetical protein
MDLMKYKPRAAMQAIIALLIVGDFSLMLFGPSLWPGWKAPDDNMTQTLLALVMLAVGYYLGSSAATAPGHLPQPPQPPKEPTP